jgi:hypothetical protein
VSTTDATVPDARMTEKIHVALAGRGLLPAEHYLDSGYPSAALVIESLSRWGITLVTPLLADTSRQARAGAGYDRARFPLDFDSEQAQCPQGKTSTWWNAVTQRGIDAIVIKFAAGTCRPCPVREQCTRSTSPKYGRQLTVPPRGVHHAQQTARATQNTTDWQARYALRAGVEGTIRQGVAVTGMRRARYRGLPKTRLQQPPRPRIQTPSFKDQLSLRSNGAVHPGSLVRNGADAVTLLIPRLGRRVAAAIDARQPGPTSHPEHVQTPGISFTRPVFLLPVAPPDGTEALRLFPWASHPHGQDPQTHARAGIDLEH